MPLLYAWTHGVLNTHVQRTGPFYAVTWSFTHRVQHQSAKSSKQFIPVQPGAVHREENFVSLAAGCNVCGSTFLFRK